MMCMDDSKRMRSCAAMFSRCVEPVGGFLVQHVEAQLVHLSLMLAHITLKVLTRVNSIIEERDKLQAQ